MSSDLREELVEQLTGEHAHISFEKAIDGIALQDTGKRPDGQPYSIWELVEHIHISQSDIVEFCQNPDYTAPDWPDEYWPSEQSPAGNEEWRLSLEAVHAGRQDMVDLIENENNDLFKPIPHGSGQTLFREAILIIDHTSYHTGQIVTIRRQLGLWQ